MDKLALSAADRFIDVLLPPLQRLGRRNRNVRENENSQRQGGKAK